jgi:molybdopterin biosynthesis enzyme
VQKKDSLLCRISQLVGAEAKFTPVLGLPGLAVTAVKAFSNFLGFVQANGRSNWLFQAASIPVVATKAVRQQPEFANGIPVRTADCIVVLEAI